MGEESDSSSLNEVMREAANYGSNGAVDLDHYCSTLIEMIA